MKKIVFPNGTLDETELLAIFKSLPFELRFIDRTGRLKFITNPIDQNFKLNEHIDKQLSFTHLPAVFDILEKFRHNKLNSFERALKVENRYFNLKMISLHDEQQNYLGCLQITQEITEFINKFKFGGFIQSDNENFTKNNQNNFHYQSANNEKYRTEIEKDLADLNSDNLDAISGASEL